MSLSVSELAGRREGEPRALSSTIGGGNDSLWKHRSRMEQSKLANVDQQDENTAYAPGRNAAVHAHAPTHLGQDDTPLLAADVNVQVVGGEPTTSCFLPVEPRTAQPYVPTILSSLFPGDSVNYGLEVDSGHAEFLPAMMRSGDMAPFDDHEQAIASWFDG